MSAEPQRVEAADIAPVEEKKEHNAIRLLTWFSVGMAIATVGFMVGHELRSRYKFKRRTPYDFYSNAGERQSSEFGVGI